MVVSYEVQAGSVGAYGPPQTGLRKYGVPPGGVFDRTSSRLANLLVGNEADHHILELASATLQMSFLESTCFALIGGGHEASLDGIELGIGIRATVEPGSVLTVRPQRGGFRAYLALPAFRAISDGESGCEQRTGRSVRLSEETHCPPSALRVVGSSVPRGKVSIHLDRMGIRVETGQERGSEQSAESRPVVYGAVQQSPDGNLLIHGPDGPTIGGYSVLAVVARVDSDRLAQLAPGDDVEFRNVTQDEAIDAFKNQEREKVRIEERLRLLAESR